MKWNEKEIEKEKKIRHPSIEIISYENAHTSWEGVDRMYARI